MTVEPQWITDISKTPVVFVPGIGLEDVRQTLSNIMLAAGRHWTRTQTRFDDRMQVVFIGVPPTPGLAQLVANLHQAPKLDVIVIDNHNIEQEPHQPDEYAHDNWEAARSIQKLLGPNARLSPAQEGLPYSSLVKPGEYSKAFCIVALAHQAVAMAVLKAIDANACNVFPGLEMNAVFPAQSTNVPNQLPEYSLAELIRQVTGESDRIKTQAITGLEKARICRVEAVCKMSEYSIRITASRFRFGPGCFDVLRKALALIGREIGDTSKSRKR
jgi:hypothetical protein